MISISEGLVNVALILLLVGGGAAGGAGAYRYLGPIAELERQAADARETLAEKERRIQSLGEVVDTMRKALDARDAEVASSLQKQLTDARGQTLTVEGRLQETAAAEANGRGGGPATARRRPLQGP